MENIVTLLPYLIDITYSATLWMLTNWHLSFPVLFIEYTIMMKGWSYAYGKSWEKYYKFTTGVFFIPQDFVVNLTIASIVFLDPPPLTTPYELVTWRMTRYIKSKGHDSTLFTHFDWLVKWRYFSALFICKLLNPHQQAVNGKNHC